MMKLIKYAKGYFVDAEKIDHIAISSKGIIFMLSGDLQSSFEVDKDMQEQFLNHLQGINDGYANIENVGHKLLKGDE